jgi:tetratricopeptide (TPR) repeat protein
MLTGNEATSEIVAHTSFFYGAASQHLRRERSAIAYYRQEIRRTSYWKAHFNLAFLLAKRGRLKEAVANYKAAARRSDSRVDKSDALNNLGLVYWRQGRRSDAIRAFRQASRANPRSAAPHINAALKLLRSGDTKEGCRWLERARGLRRTEPETESWLGYALVEHDVDVPRGVRTLQRVLKANPNDARAMADLALGYMKLGERARAKSFARRAKRLAPQDDDVNRQVRRVSHFPSQPRRR